MRAGSWCRQHAGHWEPKKPLEQGLGNAWQCQDSAEQTSTRESFPFIPADHSEDSEQVQYQVTVKTNLINRWTEFHPALCSVALLKQSGTASIMVGTTVSFYSSLLRLKYLLLLWLHSLKRIKGFYIHSKVFLSNFSFFKYFSYDVLFNLFQVIWI